MSECFWHYIFADIRFDAYFPGIRSTSPAPFQPASLCKRALSRQQGGVSRNSCYSRYTCAMRKYLPSLNSKHNSYRDLATISPTSISSKHWDSTNTMNFTPLARYCLKTKTIFGEMEVTSPHELNNHPSVPPLAHRRPLEADVAAKTTRGPRQGGTLPRIQ